MFFFFFLPTKELEFICNEILRILKPGAYNLYTVKSTNDPHYGKGIYRGEDMYELNGFIVHFSASKN
jgi:hypothetical protein